MSINSCNQLKKAQSKTRTTSQSQGQDQNKDSQAKQWIKPSKKAKKNKK